MAKQHDYDIANAKGSTVRVDMNDVVKALNQMNWGPDEPPTLQPFMFWMDTGNSLLKWRNAANNAWITIADLDGAGFYTTQISNDPYDISGWNGDTEAASKNAIRDKIALMISDVPYDKTSWNSVVDVAPTKNAIRDVINNEILPEGILKPYHGRVNSAGTTFERNPAGWSVAHPSTGNYVVTHNFGTTNYTVIAIADADGSILYNCGIVSKDMNSFEVLITENLTNTDVDRLWHFIAVLD